ncbi:MAG TPA: hypothetical protein VKX46_12830, partial [Ktedonobacteraceae bacterium]|nr:hypothetical protein [Ktedonobacteraceae bacterium]
MAPDPHHQYPALPALRGQTFLYGLPLRERTGRNHLVPLPHPSGSGSLILPEGGALMRILARPLILRDHQEPRQVRIQARDPQFFQAVAHGYALRWQEEGQVITDDTLYGVIRRVMTRSELSPGRIAGLVTGYFAALYHLPCRFEGQENAPPPIASTGGPARAIELCYADPHFPTAYGAGYQACAAVFGEQPATDEGLYAELVRDFCAHGTLSEARWCAGYLAG